MIQAGQFQAVFDQRHGAVQRGHHRIGMAQKHRGTGGRFGDVHHRHVEQLLQAFAAVLTVAGLDHRVERLVVGHHAVHHGDGRQVAFKVAFHRLRAEVGREPDNLSARRSHSPCLLGDGFSDGFGGVDVDHEDTHGVSLIND